MKKLLSSLVALLVFTVTGCSDDSSATAPDNDQPNATYLEVAPLTISGTLKEKVQHLISSTYSVENWTLGSGKIYFCLSVSDTVGIGTVQADGSFTLTLNSKIKYDLLSNLHLIITGVTANPNDVKWTLPTDMGGSMKVIPDNDATGMGKTLNISKLDMQSATLDEIDSYTFSCFDKNAVISGLATSEQNTYNINAQKGWNIVKQDFIAKTYTSESQVAGDAIFYVRTVQSN